MIEMIGSAGKSNWFADCSRRPFCTKLSGSHVVWFDGDCYAFCPVPIAAGPGSERIYCRRNGRAFRIIQGKDKRWALYRTEEIDDKGELLGSYQGAATPRKR